MDLNPSPEPLSPENSIPKSPFDDATLSISPHRSPNSPDSPSSHSPDSVGDNNMATMVAQSHAANMPGPLGVNKRYRPAPAKTFQCRGYGECRMVFSRSEHLARHIRKHTGERPFSCHCGKQFSRLDNLRQHAQTVHADKQEQNERMMRDLTSLHATMAAANKVGNPRGGRRPPPPTSNNLGHQVGGPNGSPPQAMNLVKQEELVLPMHQRPGTSSGYEGDHNSLYTGSANSWNVQSTDIDRTHPRSASNHSFRDPSQSFLAPQSSSPSAVAAQSHSFRAYSGSLSFLPDSAHDGRPRSSSSRPPTSSGSSESHSRSLPPLSAVVSASLPPPSSQQQQQQQSFAAASAAAASHQQQQQQQQQSSQHILPFPPSLGLRRPSTATRPGTAPASAAFFSSKPSFLTSGTGLVARSELPLSGYGRGSSSSYSGMGQSDNPDYDDLPSPQGQGDSPFYFHPPSIPDPQSGSVSATITSPSSINPRKRAFAGPDGPYDDAPSSTQREPPNSSSGLDYDYGSESRPQSRRLSVMELCNDIDSTTGSAFLLSAAANIASGAHSESRPTTSSGLVSSASALHIFDRNSPVASPPLLSRAQAAATSSAISGNGGGGGSSTEEFGGGGISTSVRRVHAPPVILPFRAGGGGTTVGPGSYFTHSPTFSASSTASYSPRSPAGASSSSFSPRSPISGPDANASAAVSRRGNGEQPLDQVRTFSPHSSTALGMSV